MTTKKDLSIKTATITIKVMQVDGHKLTKATYQQFQCARLERCGAKILEEVLAERKVIGWVNSDRPNILFEENGKIYRLNIMLPYNDSLYRYHDHHCKHIEFDEILKRLGIDQIYIAT